MNKEYVWEFLYCDCIYESSYATVSIHRTPEGAYKAMRTFLENQYQEWLRMDRFYKKTFKWDVHTGHDIRKREILP